ncbi:MAG TPA: SusC/RagA family TonB-linked outer membrane protein [Chryseosolibacter sp.]
MKKFILFFLCTLTFLGAEETFAQSVNIRGKVTDGTDPLPGVSILVKGENTGTTTDADGEFSLSVRPDAVLVLSFIGYKSKEVQVDGRTYIDESLETETSMLGEVVVLGYQTAAKRDVTTSIASVSSDDIKPYVSGTVAGALQGKLPGVQIFNAGGTVGAQPRILVRGLSSLTGNTNPLIIVDGLEVGYNFMNTINPQDIERVDVLKDASAAAIYGSRAGQGVILITTKRGKGETSVSVQSSLGFDYMPEVDLADASEYARVQNLIADHSGIPHPFSDPESLETTDYWKSTFKSPGVRQNYQISASGNKNGLTVYGSLGYYKETSYMGARGGEWNKLTGRLNADLEVSKRVKVGFAFAPRYEKYPHAPLNLTWNAYAMDPTTPPFKSEDSVYQMLPANYDRTAFNPYYSMPNRSQYNSAVNPEFNLRTNFSENEYFGAQYATFVEVKPVKNLTVKATLDGIANVSQRNSYTPKYYLAGDSRTLESVVNSSTYADTRWKITTTADYAGTIAGDHHFDILLGQSMDSYNEKGTTAQRIGIPFDADPYRYIPAGGPTNSGSGTYQPGAGPFGKMTSYFGSLRYDYKGKYLLGASMRADGSSMVNPKYRWGYFPTVSGAWSVSDEPFFSGASGVVNYLKLRASWGQAGGNLPGSPGSYLTVVNNTTYVDANGNAISGYVPTWISNPEIKWEVQEDYTFGVDAALFADKLNLTFEKYVRTPNNLLVGVLIDHTLGYPNGYTSYQPTNVARLRTNGWDMSLGYKTQLAPKLKLTADLTLSHYKSIVKYAGNVDPLRYGENNDGISTFRSRITKDHEPGAWYGYIVDGVFQTDDEAAGYVNTSGERLQPLAMAGDLKYRDTNGDGILDGDDLTDIGSPYPDLTTGLTLGLDYGRFDFRMEFYGAFGQTIFNASRLNMNAARWRYNFETGWADQYWDGEGSTNTFPILKTTDQNGNFSKMSTFFLEKGDFTRCRLIQLGYTLPDGLIKGIKNLRIYASLQNPFLVTGYSGMNPDVPWYSSIGYNGVDNYHALLPKTYLVGLSLGL